MAGQHAEKLVLLGLFTSAHGIKGQIKVKSFTAQAEDLLDYTPLLKEDGSPLPRLRLKGVSSGQLIVSVEGIATRDEAEKLRGVEIFAERSCLPAIEEEDAFYVEDLKGLRVLSPTGEVLGEVAEVYNFGAGDIVEIRFVNGTRESFSFTRASFPSVDLARGEITFLAPEEIAAEEPEEK